MPVKGKSGGKLSFRMNDHGSGGGCMYPVYQKELEWTVDLMLDRARHTALNRNIYTHLTEVYLQPELICLQSRPIYPNVVS